MALLGVDDVVVDMSGLSSGEYGDLLMQLESLGGGDGQGCEFGLFQREAGAEPLGLLRWSNIEPGGLIDAANTRFAGVGEPEQTQITVREINTSSEYMISDRKYGIYMHSVMAPDELPLDKAMVILKKRQKILATKLVADLTEGKKFFVYRRFSRDVTPDEIDTVHQGVRSYGKGILFYLQYENAEYPNGTVRRVRPGLVIGYIDRLAFSRSGEWLGAATASWVKLCQMAMKLA